MEFSVHSSSDSPVKIAWQLTSSNRLINIAVIIGVIALAGFFILHFYFDQKISYVSLLVSLYLIIINPALYYFQMKTRVIQSSIKKISVHDTFLSFVQNAKKVEITLDQKLKALESKDFLCLLLTKDNYFFLTKSDLSENQKEILKTR